MLVKSGIGATGGDVIFYDDACAALVGVQRPSAIAVTLDVTEDVVADHRARLGPEGVKSAHVTEPTLPYPFDQIVFDDVGAARGLLVTPVPTH